MNPFYKSALTAILREEERRKKANSLHEEFAIVRRELAHEKDEAALLETIEQHEIAGVEAWENCLTVGREDRSRLLLAQGSVHLLLDTMGVHDRPSLREFIQRSWAKEDESTCRVRGFFKWLWRLGYDLNKGYLARWDDPTEVFLARFGNVPGHIPGLEYQEGETFDSLLDLLGDVLNLPPFQTSLDGNGDHVILEETTNTRCIANQVPQHVDVSSPLSTVSAVSKETDTVQRRMTDLQATMERLQQQLQAAQQQLQVAQQATANAQAVIDHVQAELAAVVVLQQEEASLTDALSDLPTLVDSNDSKDSLI